jgi:hypothetical protein
VIAETLENLDAGIVGIGDLVTQSETLFAVAGNVRTDVAGEQRQYFARLSVTTGGFLAVQHDSVDRDVEHAAAAGHEAQVFNDVLIVAEKVVGRAHGAS